MDLLCNRRTLTIYTNQLIQLTPAEAALRGRKRYWKRKDERSRRGEKKGSEVNVATHIIKTPLIVIDVIL